MLDGIENAINSLKRERIVERDLQRSLEDILVELRAQRTIVRAVAARSGVTRSEVAQIVESMLVDFDGRPMKWEAEEANERVREILPDLD